ncbi:hypothetical protein [Methylobacter tundripaludum]|nr:hypothetical protein [Methylobacter tundripaludum]
MRAPAREPGKRSFGFARREAEFPATSANRFLIAAGLLMAAGVAGAEEPEATPYRPTVSNPAALPVPGMPEIELGGLHTSGGSEQQRDGVPFLAKYAFNADWGVMAGADLYDRAISLDGIEANGFGDTLLTVKHHHDVFENLELGFEASVKLPSAKYALGSGRTDETLNGIVSTRLGSAAVDINLGVTRLGAYGEGESRYQVTWAAAIAQPVTERWTVSAEMSGADRQGTRGTAQFLAALSYALNTRIVLDGGFALGVGSTAQNLSLFTGMTMLLGD